jgi:hypothetical protein
MEYKNKYFNPKDVPVSVKSAQGKEVNVLLLNLVRKKYLQGFVPLKTSNNSKTKTSKVTYLFNYLQNKRRYWLTFGIEKLKHNILQNR